MYTALLISKVLDQTDCSANFSTLTYTVFIASLDLASSDVSFPASPALPPSTSSSPSPLASAFFDASLADSSGASSLSGFYGVSLTASSCTPLASAAVLLVIFL